MISAKENPTEREVRGVIKLLWEKRLSAVDVHHELYAVYALRVKALCVVGPIF